MNWGSEKAWRLHGGDGVELFMRGLASATGVTSGYVIVVSMGFSVDEGIMNIVVVKAGGGGVTVPPSEHKHILVASSASTIRSVKRHAVS